MRKKIIIGGGLAGLSAALMFAKEGKQCILVSSMPSERAQSVLAQGGINASLDTKGEADSVQEHFGDTMRAGAYLADPNAVMGLVQHGPEIIKLLRGLGVPFHLDGNQVELRNFGGQKKKRTAFVASSTGKMLMTAFISEVRKYESKGLIERLAHHVFLDLLLWDDVCYGCRVVDRFNNHILTLQGSVILASGGLNGMFGTETTGTAQNAGHVTATVFRQGVHLANLEFIQYHPTTVAIEGKRMLISEAARGEGGRLFINRKGKPWYFMEEIYPELGNLMPRDMISKEMDRVVHMNDCEPQVYLDMRDLEATKWLTRLNDLRDECIHFLGKDPQKEPIPIEPGIHYFMGGIYVDEKHRTNIQNLYAAGECACQYHGANRLGGNSMLGAIYGGMVAAGEIMKNAYDEFPPVDQFTTVSEVDLQYVLNQSVFSQDECEIQKHLVSGMSLIRSEEKIQKALRQLEDMEQRQESNGGKERTLLAKAMLISAKMRKESRGAHVRVDYPTLSSAYQKISRAVFKEGQVSIDYVPVPELRKEWSGENETNH